MERNDNERNLREGAPTHPGAAGNQYQFAKALDLVGDGHYVFGVNNKFYDAAMLVLKEAVNDKYDYISWWLYEGEPDYKVWSSDNTEEWNLTEPEALYDFIVNECQE